MSSPERAAGTAQRLPAAHRQPGDRIYVYTNAYQAISRYGARYGMPIGTYDAGVCDETSTGPFLLDVDRYRGARRLWVIGSSVLPYSVSEDSTLGGTT